MRGLWPILKRELLGLFVTPIAWVIMAAFLFIEGLFFYFLIMSYSSQSDVIVGMGPAEAFFGQSEFFYFPLVLICPVLTMRLFAEERKSGTIEALLTAPVTPAAVVLGKYLATLCVYVVMWAPTVLYMFILSSHGEIDWSLVATGYAGTLLVGMAYLAIGTLASALTSSQLAAAMGATVFILAFFVMGYAARGFDEGSTRSMLEHVAVSSLMNDFSRGLVDSRRLVFWVSFAIIPLYATIRTVESWRWG
ncbi:MAG: ABC transporter permease subunit [Polyangiaceae bacterium]|nr:ABC transporter permease subunit [Polyangiaceae bacterium]